MSEDTIIVGAGIVGMACARALQLSGLRARVVDRQMPGRGCSFGNAGMIAIDHVLPLSRPDVLWRVPGMLLDPLGPLRLQLAGMPRLVPWLWRFAMASRPKQVESGTVALAALLREALPAWERTSRAAGLDDLFRRRGALTVFERDATLAAARAEERVLDAHGVRYERVDAAGVRGMAPGLSSPVAGGRYFPDIAHVVDPYRLVEALAERFVAEGGIIEQADVESFLIEGDLVRGLRTTSGDRAAAQVVVAAGAEASALARQLGVAAPLAAERGYHVMVQSAALALEMPLTFAERGFVVTPMAAGMRLAGTVELGAAATPDWRRAEVLLAHLRTLFAGADVAEASRWFGDRPTLPDYLPMIGRTERFANAVLALGHQHLGLTLAAVTGELVRDLLLGRPPAVDLEPLRCGRFGAAA